MRLPPACGCRGQRGSAGRGPAGVHPQHEQGGLHAHRLPDPHGRKRPVRHLQARRRGAAHSCRRLGRPPIHQWPGLVVLIFNKVSHRVLFSTMSSTVYTSIDLKLAVLQIRAPVIRVKFENCSVVIHVLLSQQYLLSACLRLCPQNKSKRFRQLLVSWIKSSGFSRTVVLSSSHAYQRDDQQLQGYWSLLTATSS